jgi:hypothetical protein
VNAGKNIPAVLLWNNRPDEASGNIAEDMACGEWNSMKMKAGPLQRLCRRAGLLRSGHRRQINSTTRCRCDRRQGGAGSGGRDETWPALKAAAADPAGAFTAATAEAGEEDDDEEFPPALKAAAADHTGSFTAAAAEAGGDDGEEEPPAALKAATADPRGAFTAVAAEAGGTAPGGRERVSATMLLTPATWRISEVYSATYERWRACLAVYGSETLLRAYVRGLWSVNMVNCRPSSI